MPFIIARQLAAADGTDISVAPEDPPTKQPLIIKGTEGLKLSFANCCYPIPGDPIIGLPAEGSGLVVHSESCKKAMRISDAKAQLHLSWVKDITDEFSVELRVELERQRGIIAELASAMTRAEANIERIGVDEQNAKMSVISVIIHVQGRRHLARVIKRVRSLKAVIRLNRIIDTES